MIDSASFIVNVFRVASGSFLGQLFLILSSPIITRIFSPEVFGTFAIYSAVVRLISSISPLRYDMAIIISKKKSDAANVMFVSVILVFLTVFLSFLTIKFVKHLGCRSHFIDILSTYSGIICMGILVSGLLIVFISWETRFSRFENIGIVKAIRPFFTSIIPIIYGLFFNASVYGLFMGDIVGALVGLIFLFFVFLKKTGSIFYDDISRLKSFELMRRYKNLPVYSTWSVLVNSLSLQIPVIILINYYSASIAGCFALANRLLQIPMGIFNSSVGQVFFKSSADSIESANIHVLVIKTLSRLIMISIFPIIIISLLGPDIFQLVFGNEWYKAGQYIQVLSLWCFSAFLVGPLSNLVIIYEKQNIGLIINIIRMLSRLGSLVFGAHFTNSPLLALTLFSVSSFLTNIGFLFWILKISKSSIKRSLFSFFKYGFIALSFSAPLIFSVWVFSISSIMKIVISFALLVGYYLYILSQDSGLRILIKKAIIANS